MKIESVQYDAALSIVGAIKGTSRERLYQELGLESLGDRRWYRRLVSFFKLFKKTVRNITKLLPTRQISYNIDRSNLYCCYRVNTNYFKNLKVFPLLC